MSSRSLLHEDCCVGAVPSAGVVALDRESFVEAVRRDDGASDGVNGSPGVDRLNAVDLHFNVAGDLCSVYVTDERERDLDGRVLHRRDEAVEVRPTLHLVAVGILRKKDRFFFRIHVMYLSLVPQVR